MIYNPSIEDRFSWRSPFVRMKSEEKLGLGMSVVVHTAIFSAFLFSLGNDTKPRRLIHEVKAFEVSMVPLGDPASQNEKVKPKAAAPRMSDAPKPDDEPVEEIAPSEQNESDEAADAAPAGSLGDGLIWTPPPPSPEDARISAQSREARRVEMPMVSIGPGASEPILISYDEGRFSDAAAVREAERLSSAGSIVMSVMVDQEGLVGECQIQVTSGSKILDEKACELIRSYRYRPAQDEKGVPRSAIVTEILEWARDGRFGTISDARSVRNMAAAGVPAPETSLRSARHGMPAVGLSVPQGRN